MAFAVGELVRLKRGWTMMQVIWVSPCMNRIRAKYANNSYYPVTSFDFEAPFAACSCQTRANGEFVYWDKPICNASYYNREYYRKSGEPKVKQFMLKTARANRPTSDIIGTHVGTTKEGLMILEFRDGYLETHVMDNLREFKQRGIKLRAANNGREYYFLISEGAQLSNDDLVVSEEGSIYTVVDANFDYQRSPSTWFKGKRLVTQDF